MHGIATVEALVIERMNGLLGREKALSIVASAATPVLASDPDTAGFVQRICALSTSHSAELRQRLHALGGEASILSDVDAMVSSPRFARPAQALASLAGAVLQAVAEYGELLHLACRARDSWIAAAEGTTAHLARQFIQDYQVHLGRMPTLLGQTVTGELDDMGSACRCTCASCSMGLCMCGQNLVWREAWSAARGLMEDGGARIPRPRPGSHAHDAGFLGGDLIVAVGETPTDSGSAVIAAIKGNMAEAPIGFEVRRNGESLKLRALKQAPDDRGQQGSLECTTPSGQPFYLDRARDLQRQVRRGNKPVLPHPDGLAGLTPRELQVLRLVADGATNRMIAERLRIRPPTVARHLQGILGKLGAANRAEAAGIAAIHGLRADA